MNDAHLTYLASQEWREMLRDRVLPFALGPAGAGLLGDDVLEIGPGPGLTTDLLRTQVAKLTSIEIDPVLAGDLRDRLDGANVEVVDGDSTAMPFTDGRFSGAVTFTMLHHVPTIDLQDAVFAEVCRVLRSGGVLVASDSLASAELAGFHVDDIYNPVDPATLPARLSAAGFDAVEVRTNPYAWTCRAVAP